MSNRAPKSKPKKQRQRAAKTQSGTSLRRITIGAISAALTILGGVVAVLALLPRISVTPGDPVDPNDTFSAAFTISNNNFIPLRHVAAALMIDRVMPYGVPLDKGAATRHSGSGLVRPEWANHDLDMDDRFTITPSDIFQFSSPREASIAIVVSYRTWLLPWESTKGFRFITHKQTDGRLYWFQLPSN